MNRLLLLTTSILLAAFLAATPVSAGEEALRIVTFGTSLTARGGWQTPLRAELERCLKRPVVVDVVALSGSTSDWGLAHVGEVVSRRPDVVLMEFYANDAALNRSIGFDESRANVAAMLDQLRTALPDARIETMAMNPMHGLRGWLRPFLDDYIDAHRAIALEKGSGFVDFRPLWAQMFADDISEAIPDGSHPRPDAAARVMVPELVRRLAPECAR